MTTPTPEREPALPEEIERGLGQIHGQLVYQWQHFTDQQKEDLQTAFNATRHAIAMALVQTKVDEYESCAQAFLEDVEKHQALRERAERLRREVLWLRSAASLYETAGLYEDELARRSGIVHEGDLADDLIQHEKEGS